MPSNMLETLYSIRHLDVLSTKLAFIVFDCFNGGTVFGEGLFLFVGCVFQWENSSFGLECLCAVNIIESASPCGVCTLKDLSRYPTSSLWLVYSISNRLSSCSLWKESILAMPSRCTHIVPTPGRSPILLMVVLPVLVCCNCNFQLLFRIFVRKLVFQKIWTVDWLSSNIHDLLRRPLVYPYFPCSTAHFA